VASVFDLIPHKYLAAQLRKPTGLFGVLTARTLNRQNVSLNTAVLDALTLVSGDRVLEVGFGGGDLLSRILPLVGDGRVLGADFSVDMVALCRLRFASFVESGHLELVVASVDSMPFESGSASKACAVNALYFWDDPHSAFTEFLRVLEPGGRLVIGFSPRETLQGIPATRHGFRLYDALEVRALLGDTGFRVLEMRKTEHPRGISYCAIAEKPAGE